MDEGVAAPSEVPAADATRYAVAVRTLCEFSAKTGDLDLRFTPSPSAQEGIAGHQAVQNRRDSGYLRELQIEGSYGCLTLRGRIDGVDPAQRRIEEIKTCVGSPDEMPANQRALHWAQAMAYGALLCRQHGWADATLALVYFDVREQRELPHLVRHCTAAELDHFLAALCEKFLAWARREARHRERRNLALEHLAFPFDEFRPGQRELAKAVFNAARGSLRLLAQAPTGLGKTLAAIFPMLKAWPRAKLDKVFFLTAKGSGRSVALGGIRALQARHPGLALRTLELTARSKACEHPDKACHGDACPLARGFYDRLPAARTAAVERAMLSKDVVREVALAHDICPYYLAQELTRWCDVVLADYNHYFDRSALLYALAQENDWRVGLLVDEAHNLVDRGRSMYTASLSSRRLRGRIKTSSPAVAAASARVRRQWLRIAREAEGGYTELSLPPRSLETAVHELNAALAEHFAQFPSRSDAESLELYFDALAFERALQSFGGHSLIDVQDDAPATMRRAPPDATITVRNVVPAPFLGPRLAAACSAVLFSATLAPWQFYVDVLGLPEDTACVDVPSPFDPKQLRVRVVREISTRYRDRDASIAPIARLVEDEYRRCPGNYLVFLSSHEYLERIADRFSTDCPNIQVWRQNRQMSDEARSAFLERFVPGGCGVGFAVLGGVFAEGIDLTGSRLVGAFVATLGLPQVNEINEAMRRRIDQHFGAGYDYTYLYPGLRKVVQAAGRVIRTETDRGCLYLIDDRFARKDVRKLLPAWWSIESIAR